MTQDNEKSSVKPQNWLMRAHDFCRYIRCDCLIALASFLVAFLGLCIAYNQYEMQKAITETQARMHRYEVDIVEGQLAASLLTSLIRGDENERQLAILILKSKAPKLFDELAPVIIAKDPSLAIRETTQKEYTDFKFTNLLKDARIYMELKRYGSAAQYFYQASTYADTSEINTALLETAISRYHAHSDSLAAALFQEVFLNY